MCPAVLGTSVYTRSLKWIKILFDKRKVLFGSTILPRDLLPLRPGTITSYFGWADM